MYGVPHIILGQKIFPPEARAGKKTDNFMKYQPNGLKAFQAVQAGMPMAVTEDGTLVPWMGPERLWAVAP
jgi:hypothetical protein